MYDPNMVQTMRDELVQAGIQELRTAAEVDHAFAESAGTTLVFINSVCGCSAGTARPGLIKSLEHGQRPDRVATVFAGVDREATEQVRGRIAGHPPSSPSVALFRDGQLVDMISRQEIEIRSADALTQRLTQSFDRFCGPEVDTSVVIEDPFAQMEISPIEVKELRDAGTPFEFLDVRTEPEHALASIEGSRLVTQELFQEITDSWPRDKKIVIFCHTGQRSLEATKFLRLRQGFTDIRSMSGGITAWSAVVDRAVPTY